MHHRFIIILLAFFFQIGSGMAQESPSRNQEELAELVNAELDMAWIFRDRRPDSTLYHANKAFRLSKSLNRPHLRIKSINYIGIAYRNLSNYSKAFEKYLEALELAEEHGDGEQRGYALINLGNLYLYQTNFQGAIRYFIKALDQSQSLANKRMMGYCYTNLGRSYRGTAEYGQAELYFQQAIDIRVAEGDYYGQMAAEIDLAETYLRKGEYERALSYFRELKEKIKPEDLRLHANTLEKMSRAQLAISDTKGAEKSAFSALEIAKEVSARFDEKNILDVMSQIYAKSEDYRNAYLYHKKYSDLNQQLFSEENIRRIEQLKNQNQIERQEAENEFLRQQTELKQLVIDRQRIIIVLSVVAIVTVLAIAIISIRASRIRKRLLGEIQAQKDRIEKDKNLIQAQSEKLKELDEAKSRFFANVSHDLRTPLSLILGNLEILKMDEESIITPQGKQNLEIGLKNCKRLIYLTDEINDLTRLEEGKITLKKEAVKMGSYIGMLSEMFTGTAAYKGVSLKLENKLGNADRALIDPRQFEKIFYNLVSNAIRYTAKGDSIFIRTERIQEWVIVSVEDTGEGISPKSLPYIFDRFYQSKDNEYKSREGLGIGLALVKELIDLHDGQITVESEPDVGTKFKMLFKSTKESVTTVDAPDLLDQITKRKHLYDELDRETSAGPSIPKLDEAKDTILLVDDHPEIRYHIRQILEDNYHIIEAAHGIEALDLLKMNKVDIIISDLMMPYMDGFELIESIKTNESYSRIPILVVSARISDQDHEKVLYKGINDYLQKPFQKKELILRINNLLRQKEKWQQSEDNQLLDVFEKANLSSLEEDIIKKVEALVMDRIDDPNLSVFDLSDAMAASERQVYRLIKKITGLTPHEYVTEVKMKYVDFLIRKNKVKNASEAARSIGLKNVTTFSRQFEKRFGKKPSEIIQD